MARFEFDSGEGEGLGIGCVQQICAALRQCLWGAALAWIVFCFPSIANASQVKMLVARTTIYPGQAIHMGSLSWKNWRGSKQQLVGYLTEPREAVGKVARRTLIAGRPIAITDLRVPNVVGQGQVVTIVFRSAAIQIVGRAVALQGGSAGALVRVRNVDSRRVIIGTVQNDGSVLVGAPR